MATPPCGHIISMAILDMPAIERERERERERGGGGGKGSEGERVCVSVCG